MVEEAGGNSKKEKAGGREREGWGQGREGWGQH